MTDLKFTIKSTKRNLEILAGAQKLLKDSKLDLNQLIALQKLNTLEFFLEGTLKMQESNLEFEKKRKKLLKA